MIYLGQCLALLAVMTIAPSSNRRECSLNSAMDGGCHLLDYNGQWVTTKCDDGYIMNVEGNCIIPCPLGQYMFGTQCNPCSRNCQRCSGPLDSDCAECLPGYSKNFQDVCTFTCRVENRLYGIPATATAANADCFPCDLSCATCINRYETTCTSCALSASGGMTTLQIFDYASSYTRTGYCIANPPLAFANYYRKYPGDTVVVECPLGCSTCIDSFRCTSCYRGYSLHPNAGATYARCYADPTDGN